MRVLERCEITSGDERQVRFGLYPEDVVDIEARSELGYLYRCWNEAPAAADGVRYLSVIDRLSLLPVAASDFVTIVGTDVQSSYNFYVISPAQAAPFDFEHTERIGEIVSPLNRKAQVVEYAFAKRDRQIKVDEVHQWLKTPSRVALQTRSFLRFLYPLCDREGQIVRLMIATRLLAENVRPLSSALQMPLFTAA